MTTAIERQTWLDFAAAALAERFQAAGFEVPANVRVGFGWPKGARGPSHAIGQCWGSVASSDQHNEIFISPALGLTGTAIENDDNGASEDRIGQSARIVDVLAHELVHAIVGVEVGHKAEFKRCATAIGLTGKMTATVATPDLADWSRQLVERLGTFPTGGLSSHQIKKQSTRLLKCVCPACGYVARVTAKWIADSGAPICPSDGSTFDTD